MTYVVESKAMKCSDPKCPYVPAFRVFVDTLSDGRQLIHLECAGCGAQYALAFKATKK
jgi:hypothetical protein